MCFGHCRRSSCPFWTCFRRTVSGWRCVNASWKSSSSTFVTLITTASLSSVCLRGYSSTNVSLSPSFRHQQEPTRDPVILNALLHICKTMHDSVKWVSCVSDVPAVVAWTQRVALTDVCVCFSALTLDDEKRALALLINGFIRMVRWFFEHLFVSYDRIGLR